MVLSHVAVTSMAVLQVVLENKGEREKIAFTALTGLHLTVLFISFTYYWRLYSVQRRSTLIRLNRN